MSRNAIHCSKEDNVLTVFTRSAKVRSVARAGERIPLISTGAMKVACVFCTLFRSQTTNLNENGKNYKR